MIPTELSMTIGRLPSDVMWVPEDINFYDNGGLAITGHIGHDAASPALVRAARGAWLSLSENGDEPVVPVEVPSDPTLSGFYRPRRATANTDGSPTWYQVKVDLDPVRDFAQPMVDVTALAIHRAGYAIDEEDCQSQYWRPSEVISESRRGTFGGGGEFTRATATGEVGGYVGGSGGVNSGVGQLTVWRYALAAADWYTGACALEVSFDGGDTWIVWPGSQVPAGFTDWRLTNGLVRVWLAGGDDLAVQHYDGTQWETAKIYTLKIDGGADIAGWSMSSVMRNGSHIVSMRLAGHIPLFFSSGDTAGGQLDLTLKRGDRWVYGRSQTVQGVASITRATPEAATSGTGGLYAAGVDGDGNRYVLASAALTTKDTTNGGLSTNALDDWESFDFGIGAAIGGSTSAIGVEGSPSLLEQYGRWVSEQVRVATL
jgi:hypothetical protein